MVEDLIEGRVGVVEASRYIASARFKLKQSKNDLFIPFVGIDSQTDQFPLGTVREQWGSDALRRYDLDREKAEQTLASRANEAALPLLVWVRSQVSLCKDTPTS